MAPPVSIAICIDYDNLSAIQKSTGILDVVSKTLHKISDYIHTKNGSCEVRLYGGWYEGSSLSGLSQSLSVKIQNDFPSIIRILNKNSDVCSLRATAELAYSLLEEPGHQLFNTYRRKGKPNNIRVETKESIGCNDSLCPLPMAKKLLQKGSCPTTGCITSGTPLIYRHEQKLVDTMLACDLIYLADKNYTHLIVISADDDFLPPIRILALRGANVIRVHPQLNSNHQPVRVGSSHLMELGL